MADHCLASKLSLTNTDSNDTCDVMLNRGFACVLALLRAYALQRIETRFLRIGRRYADNRRLENLSIIFLLCYIMHSQ